MSTASKNSSTNKWEISVPHGSISYGNSSTKTLTIATGGTYVDQDIVVTTTASATDSTTSVSIDDHDLVVSPSVTPTSRAEASSGTSGLLGSVATSAPSSGYYISVVGGNTATSGSSTAGESASVSWGTGHITGSKDTITSHATASAVANSKTVYYPVTAGILSNTATSGTTYGNNTTITIPSKGSLYINAGYYPATQITLDQMLDGAEDTAAVTAANHILSGYVAYNVDGEKITGTIDTKTNTNLTSTANGATVTTTVPAGYYAQQYTSSATVASGTAGTPSASVTASLGSWALQTSGTNSGKYTATISGSSDSGATVTNTTGYITGGTKTGEVTASGTAVLDAAVCTIAGGTVSATAGTASASASCTSTGMTNGISSTATSYYVTASASASATGGSASITDVTDKHTAGYLPAKTAATVISGTSKAGDSDTKSDSKTVYLKAAALTHGDVSGTAGTVSKTVTGITTSTSDTGYKVTFSASSGTISCTSSISAGYTEGDSKTATITATPNKPTDVYFATTTLSNSVTATLTGGSTSEYSAPTTVSASTTVPQLCLTGSGSGTLESVLISNGTADKKYINYYTGTYTIA